MCNKMTFPTPGEARKHLKTILARPRKGKQIKRLHVYQCHECNNYHLTSKSKSEQKRIMRGLKNE